MNNFVKKYLSLIAIGLFLLPQTTSPVIVPDNLIGSEDVIKDNNYAFLHPIYGIDLKDVIANFIRFDGRKNATTACINALFKIGGDGSFKVHDSYNNVAKQLTASMIENTIILLIPFIQGKEINKNTLYENIKDALTFTNLEQAQKLKNDLVLIKNKKVSQQQKKEQKNLENQINKINLATGKKAKESNYNKQIEELTQNIIDSFKEKSLYHPWFTITALLVLWAQKANTKDNVISYLSKLPEDIKNEVGLETYKNSKTISKDEIENKAKESIEKAKKNKEPQAKIFDTAYLLLAQFNYAKNGLPTLHGYGTTSYQGHSFANCAEGAIANILKIITYHPITHTFTDEKINPEIKKLNEWTRFFSEIQKGLSGDKECDLVENLPFVCYNRISAKDEKNAKDITPLFGTQGFIVIPSDQLSNETFNEIIIEDKKFKTITLLTEDKRKITYILVDPDQYILFELKPTFRNFIMLLNHILENKNFTFDDFKATDFVSTQFETLLKSLDWKTDFNIKNLDNLDGGTDANVVKITTKNFQIFTISLSIGHGDVSAEKSQTPLQNDIYNAILNPYINMTTENKMPDPYFLRLILSTSINAPNTIFDMFSSGKKFENQKSSILPSILFNKTLNSKNSYNCANMLKRLIVYGFYSYANTCAKHFYDMNKDMGDALQAFLLDIFKGGYHEKITEKIEQETLKSILDTYIFQIFSLKNDKSLYELVKTLYKNDYGLEKFSQEIYSFISPKNLKDLRKEEIIHLFDDVFHCYVKINNPDTKQLLQKHVDIIEKYIKDNNIIESLNQGNLIKFFKILLNNNWHVNLWLPEIKGVLEKKNDNFFKNLFKEPTFDCTLLSEQVCKELLLAILKNCSQNDNNSISSDGIKTKILTSLAKRLSKKELFNLISTIIQDKEVSKILYYDKKPWKMNILVNYLFTSYLMFAFILESEPKDEDLNETKDFLINQNEEIMTKRKRLSDLLYFTNENPSIKILSLFTNLFVNSKKELFKELKTMPIGRIQVLNNLAFPISKNVIPQNTEIFIENVIAVELDNEKNNQFFEDFIIACSNIFKALKEKNRNTELLEETIEKINENDYKDESRKKQIIELKEALEKVAKQ